jgi:hypothetical protein
MYEVFTTNSRMILINPPLPPPQACGAATQKCEGSSVPGDGLRPLFNIKCGTEYYVGSDQYHFDPSTDEFQRLYRCNGHTDDERATWTLLGYFVEGACDFLQNAE